eukprot:975496-Prorocentrum_minimum.AAC.2
MSVTPASPAEGNVTAFLAAGGDDRLLALGAGEALRARAAAVGADGPGASSPAASTSPPRPPRGLATATHRTSSAHPTSLWRKTQDPPIPLPCSLLLPPASLFLLHTNISPFWAADASTSARSPRTSTARAPTTAACAFSSATRSPDAPCISTIDAPRATATTVPPSGTTASADSTSDSTSDPSPEEASFRRLRATRRRRLPLTPSATSQVMSTPASSHDATRLSPSKKHTPRTTASWPRRFRSTDPSASVHTLTVQSWLPETRRSPLAVIARHRTQSPCAASTCHKVIGRRPTEPAPVAKPRPCSPTALPAAPGTARAVAIPSQRLPWPLCRAPALCWPPPAPGSPAGGGPRVETRADQGRDLARARIAPPPSARSRRGPRGGWRGGGRQSRRPGSQPLAVRGYARRAAWPPPTGRCPAEPLPPAPSHPRRGPIRGGTRGYTRGGDPSEEGREDIPETRTNRRRDERIYPSGFRRSRADQVVQQPLVEVAVVPRTPPGVQLVVYTCLLRPSLCRRPPCLRVLVCTCCGQTLLSRTRLRGRGLRVSGFWTNLPFGWTCGTRPAPARAAPASGPLRRPPPRPASARRPAAGHASEWRSLRPLRPPPPPGRRASAAGGARACDARRPPPAPPVTVGVTVAACRAYLHRQVQRQRARHGDPRVLREDRQQGIELAVLGGASGCARLDGAVHRGVILGGLERRQHVGGRA